MEEIRKRKSRDEKEEVRSKRPKINDRTKRKRNDKDTETENNQDYSEKNMVDKVERKMIKRRKTEAEDIRRFFRKHDEH